MDIILGLFYWRNNKICNELKSRSRALKMSFKQDAPGLFIMKEAQQQEIFDIQTFSLHDGPGIRTTVFFKGCPLRCQWCSNPEGLESGPTLSYQIQKCIHCLDCVESCPTGALTSKQGKLVVKNAECNGCGRCVELCPGAALKLYGYQQSPEKLIERIKKDRKYFEKSGGGLTLSGGEVMMQAGYALDILRLAKEEHIHTCIETCGYASQDKFAAILPFVDLFLFDYKFSDSGQHKKYTGVSNEKILYNLKFLNQEGAQIVLRVPIIPGVNDNELHFLKIAEISNELQGIQRVELLPYHNWGEHKYEETGWPNPGLESKSVSPEMAHEWLGKLKEMGCKNVVIS